MIGELPQNLRLTFALYSPILTSLVGEDPMSDLNEVDTNEALEDPIMLTVIVQRQGDVPLLRCVGRIVRGDETALICAAVQLQARSIILDLTEIDAIDAAGIGLLVSMQAAGFYLTLLNPTPHVRDLLRVTKLDSILEVRELYTPQDLIAEVTAGAESQGFTETSLPQAVAAS